MISPENGSTRKGQNLLKRIDSKEREQREEEKEREKVIAWTREKYFCYMALMLCSEPFQPYRPKQILLQTGKLQM